MPTDIREPLTLADFENLVGDAFAFSIEGVAETATGELVSAESLLQRDAPAGQREPFRLLFKFPPGADLGQYLFQMKHPRLSTDAIFLVPVAGDETGWYMDASFS